MNKKLSPAKQKKQAELVKAEHAIKHATSAVLWDYSGLTSNEVTELRKAIKKAGGQNNVFKNTISEIAFEKEGKKDILPYLKGPSSLLFTFEHNNDAIKTLYNVIQANKKIKFKAGYIDGTFYDTHKILEVAGLPGKTELIGMVASALAGSMRNLAYALDQVAKTKTE